MQPGSFPLPALTITFLLFLSGCIGASGSTPPTTDRITPGGFDEETGSIDGFVSATDLAPIVGAQVGIPALGLATTTDEAGQFALGFIPTGTHTVFVVAPGFESTSRNVEVRAGEATSGVSFGLIHLATPGPYHVNEIHKRVFGGVELKATPDCMYLGGTGGSASLKTCQGWSTQCDPGLCEIHYGHCNEAGSDFANYGCDFTPDWKTIVAEVDWIQTSSLTGGGFSLEVLAPNITRSNGDSGSVDQSDPHDFWKISSKPPIQWTIDDAALAARTLPPEDRCGGIDVEYPNCDWVWRIFATWCSVHGLTGGAAGCDKFGPDFGLMQDQAVTVYWSYFIGEPAPDAFSAIPDA